MLIEASSAIEPTEIDPAAAPADGVVVETPDAKTAESSVADSIDAKPEAPASLLDVVRDAVKKPDAEPAASSATVDDQAKAAVETPAVEAVVPDADLPFHNHPRWKQVLEERNALQAPAENYRKITDYMEATGLQPVEVAEGFEIMGLLKSGDPANLAKARDWFADRLQALNESLGDVLPADLQAKVESGLVEEETARELARTRAAATRLETQNAARTTQDEEARAASEASTQAAAMSTAVQSWEDGIKAKDPDYSDKKASLVENQCRAIIQKVGRSPANPEEALALVQRAYGEVNESLKAFVPKPKPVIPAPNGLSARAAVAPKTLREAIAAAVQR